MKAAGQGGTGMDRIRYGNFLVELSGADVVWERVRTAQADQSELSLTDQGLRCEVCGLEVQVVNGSGSPSCCDQLMRSTSEAESFVLLAS